MNKDFEWKDKRIAEINLWSKKNNRSCSESNPYFEEVYAIYRSKAKTYKDFLCTDLYVSIQRLTNYSKNKWIKKTA
tara:strand:- start:1706 stop:1933 length:228 start_codon:yes stop_codon:yes gene_type:complete